MQMIVTGAGDLQVVLFLSQCRDPMNRRDTSASDSSQAEDNQTPRPTDTDTDARPTPPTPHPNDSNSPDPLLANDFNDYNTDPDNDSDTDNDETRGFGRPLGILAGVGKMILETGPVALPLRGLGHAFRALEHVDYRYIWMGALLSNMGTWIQNVAIQWLIKSLAIDSSALWLGRAAFFQQIPAVLLLPLGGVLADRVDRRWIMLAGNLCLAILSLILALTYGYGHLRMWHLIAAASVSGVMSAMLIPANQSLLPTLVSKQNLPNAVALNSMQFNLSRAVGPAIGGAALVSLGAAWSFGINAFTFVFIITALMLIQRPKATPRQKEKFLVAITGGAKYLRHRKDLLLMLCVVFISGAAASPIMFMLPAVVEQLFDDNARQFSFLLSSFGLGAVCGAILLAARSHKYTSPWRGFITMGLFGLLECLISFQSSFPVTLALVFLCGMTFISSLNRFFAATIGSIPNHIRGRVSSIHVLCLMLGFPIGSVLAGTIAESFGMIPVLRYFGLTLVAALCVAGFLIWKFNLVFIEYDTSEHAQIKS